MEFSPTSVVNEDARRPSYMRAHPILTTIGIVVALLVSVALGVAALISSGHQNLAESRYQWPALIGYPSPPASA